MEEPESDEEALDQPSMQPPAKRPKPHPNSRPTAAAAATPHAPGNLLRAASPIPGDSEHSHHSTNSQHVPSQVLDTLQHAQSPAWHQQQQQRLQYGKPLVRPGKALPRHDQLQQAAAQQPAAVAAPGALLSHVVAAAAVGCSHMHSHVTGSGHLCKPGAVGAAVPGEQQRLAVALPPPAAAAGRRPGADFSQLLRVMKASSGAAPADAAAGGGGGGAVPSASYEKASAATSGEGGNGGAAPVPLSEGMLVSQSLDMPALEQEQQQQQQHRKKKRKQKAEAGKEGFEGQQQQHQQQQQQQQPQQQHTKQQQETGNGVVQDHRCRADLSGQLVLLSAELSCSVGAGPQQQQQQQQPPQEGFKGESATQQVSRRKQRNSYIYGNYRHYYGYRLEHGHEDPRVKVGKRYGLGLGDAACLQQSSCCLLVGSSGVCSIRCLEHVLLTVVGLLLELF